MKITRTKRFTKNLNKLPEAIKKKLDKQLVYLVSDLRHPSLRAKKYDESQGIWQARIDDHFRLYFVIDSDTYVLFNILPHSD